MEGIGAWLQLWLGEGRTVSKFSHQDLKPMRNKPLTSPSPGAHAILSGNPSLYTAYLSGAGSQPPDGVNLCPGPMKKKQTTHIWGPSVPPRNMWELVTLMLEPLLCDHPRDHKCWILCVVISVFLWEREKGNHGALQFGETGCNHQMAVMQQGEFQIQGTSKPILMESEGGKHTCALSSERFSKSPEKFKVAEFQTRCCVIVHLSGLVWKPHMSTLSQWV